MTKLKGTPRFMNRRILRKSESGEKILRKQ